MISSKNAHGMHMEFIGKGFWIYWQLVGNELWKSWRDLGFRWDWDRNDLMGIYRNNSKFRGTDGYFMDLYSIESKCERDFSSAKSRFEELGFDMEHLDFTMEIWITFS